MVNFTLHRGVFFSFYKMDITLPRSFRIMKQKKTRNGPEFIRSDCLALWDAI